MFVVNHEGEWLKNVDLKNLDSAAASKILTDYDKSRKGWLNKEDTHSLVAAWGAANAVSPSEQEAAFTKFWESTNTVVGYGLQLLFRQFLGWQHPVCGSREPDEAIQASPRLVRAREASSLS